MATNNYVPASQKKEYQSVSSFVPQQPIDLGAVFGDSPAPARGGYSHSPYERGLEFAIKYAPLFVIELILSIGIAWRAGWDVPMWLCLFGLMAFVGYWMLGFMENIFEPTSGHVVRYFFSWLVARQYIQSNERLAVQSNQLEYMRQFNAWQEQRRLEMQAENQIQRHSAPQSQLNRLTSYKELPEWKPSADDPYPVDVISVENTQVMENAYSVLLDFVMRLYRDEGLIKANGILKKGVIAPWTDRGVMPDGNETPAPVKRRLLDMINQTVPALFKLNQDSKMWQLNIEDYPAVDDALSILDDVCERKL